MLAFLLLAAACGGPEVSRRNLLLVVVDTLRADYLSAYGYDRPTSPHIDRLAAAGARFDAAYATCATTGPTHATLFTGLYPRAAGVRRNAVPLSPRHHTLAERLRDAGYQTAAIVSSFVLDERFGFDQGFEHYDDEMRRSQTTVHHKSFEGHRVRGGFDRRASATTDRALAWLDGARDERPFLLFVHYFDPHAPYVAPPEWLARFAARDEPRVRVRARSFYAAEVAYTDHEIGRLLGGLEAAGLEDSTLVVLTSDHGEGLFEHGYAYHDVHLYEEALRVPLLMRAPRAIAPGRVLREPASLTDVMPTLLGLLEVPWDAAALPGRNLAPVLVGEAAAPPRPIFFERRLFSSMRVGDVPVVGEAEGVRVGPWKYLEAREQGQVELYHLERDAEERENLAEREPERARELSRTLASWRDATPAVPSIAPSADDLERLRALGYAD